VGTRAARFCYPAAMKRSIDKRLTDRARALRNNPTPQERILWRLLSRYRTRFTRQLPLDPLRRRSRLPGSPPDCRDRRQPTLRIQGGCRPNPPARTGGLDADPLLEQRSERESRRCRRSDPAQSRRVPRRNPPPAPPFQGGENEASSQPLILSKCGEASLPPGPMPASALPTPAPMP